MHPDQIDVDAARVARIVADQFPQWAGLDVRSVRSAGTVNALFRLGDRYVLRFPLQPDRVRAGQLIAEQAHARAVARYVSLAVPEPVAIGRPGIGYPGPWTVYRWIDGQSADTAATYEADSLAEDLATFVGELHSMPTDGRRWAGTGRGGPLAAQDERVQHYLVAAEPFVDAAAVRRVWQDCLTAERPSEPDVMLHTDLMPGNLIVRDGRLVAVIDLGDGQVGDPAVDLMPAWNLLPGTGRATLRRRLAVDDAQWARGRGWAIVQAVPAVAYYRRTNPVMSGLAVRTLQEAVAATV